MPVMRDILEDAYQRRTAQPEVDLWTLITTEVDPFKRTAKEIAAGITPVNYAYRPGNVHRYALPSTTDWTTAITTAYAATGAGGGGYVEFEAQTYSFSSLSFSGALNLRIVGKNGGNVGNTSSGSFAGATVLQSTTVAGTAITFAGPTYNSKQIKIENLVINASTNGSVVSFSNCSDIIFENVMVVNDGNFSGAIGVTFSQCYYVFCNELFVLKGLNQRAGISRGVVIDMAGAASILAGQYNFKNCSFQTFQTGVAVGDASPSVANEHYANLNFINCEFLANDVGIALQHGVNAATILGCYVEANTSVGIFVTLEASAVTIKNSFFNNPTAAFADVRFGLSGGGSTQYQQFYNCSVEGCHFQSVNIKGVDVSAIAGAFADIWNSRFILATAGAIGVNSNLTDACRVSNCSFSGFAAANTVTGSTAPPLTSTQGTFTATMTGLTAVVTGTAYYHQIGNQVTLLIPSLTGTSNTTACTVTGLPSALWPAHDQGVIRVSVINNSVALATGLVQLNTAGTLSAYPTDAFGGWTAAGTKTVFIFNYTYLLT